MSDFMAKMHQIVCWLGLCPRPRWGSLQRSPRLHSWIFGGLLLRERREGGSTGGDGRGPPAEKNTYLMRMLELCFRKSWRRKFIFGLRVHPLGKRVEFVHEGHRVKVRAKAAKEREIPHFRNVKLQSPVTPVL